MPQPLLSALFSSPALKITNARSGLSVLLPIRTVRVGISLPSRLSYQQFEDGSIKVDQRFLLPITVAIELISPTMDVVGQVNSVTADRESTYTISSRGLVVEDMRVTSEALDQSPENISSTPTRLSFAQLMFQDKEKVVYRQSADASLIDRGTTFLTNARQTASDIVEKVKTSISELV